MSSPNSPCAACKCLRRKCTQDCVFGPYFPADNPQKFNNVHKVFGASNVSKLVNELNAAQREDAVNSLAYEAEYRLRDPVYGCVGLISILQQRLKQFQLDLDSARKELSAYIGQQHTNFGPGPPYNMQHMMAQLNIRDPQQQQQQFLEMAAMQHHQQNELLRFNSGFDDATGFNQVPAAIMLQQQQLHLQPQELLQLQHQPTGGDKGRSIGPSCSFFSCGKILQ